MRAVPTVAVGIGRCRRYASVLLARWRDGLHWAGILSPPPDGCKRGGRFSRYLRDCEAGGDDAAVSAVRAGVPAAAAAAACAAVSVDRSGVRQCGRVVDERDAAAAAAAAATVADCCASRSSACLDRAAVDKAVAEDREYSAAAAAAAAPVADCCASRSSACLDRAAVDKAVAEDREYSAAAAAAAAAAG